MSNAGKVYLQARVSVRNRLLAATCLTLVFPGVSLAQEAAKSGAKPDGATSVEEIVITGSRLASPGLLSASPVAVTSQEDIKAAGQVNAEAVIRDLPSAAPGRSSATNNNGNGNTTINLRDLGEVRTLVLVDGKRLPPADFSGVMDIDSIPTAMIQRVEVLTGGASAVYGSDAVAGVVNFILRKNFQGLELDAQYGATGQGDGRTYDLNLIGGANSADGKGNITAWAGYTKRDPILAGERSWSSVIYGSNGTSLIPTGSGTIPAGRDLSAGLMFNANNQLVPYDGRTFNAQPDKFLIVPQERYQLGAEGEYEIASSLKPYFRVSYSQNKVDRQLGSPGFVGSVQVDYGNPLLSDQERSLLFSAGPHAATDLATFSLSRRLPESPFIQERNNYQQFQIVLGATGDLGAGFAYEVFGQYGHVEWSQHLFGDISFNRFQQGLLVSPNGSCTDTTGGCVPINIFTAAAGAITPAQVAFFTLQQQAISESEQTVAGGSLTGDLAHFGAKSPWASEGVKVALGVEYRKETASYDPDDNLAVGNNVVFGAIPPTAGSINVSEIYGEVRVPVAQDQPFARLLELNGGYRHSDYNLAGNTETYKYGAVWAPIDDLRFRASFDRAVRAPTIGELFAPAQPSADVAIDPCFANGAAGPTAAKALCVATGVPAANYGAATLQCFSTQCTSLVGGNTALGVERSDTKSIGLVLQPRAIRGFTATIDYYDITINGAIAPFGNSVQNVFDNCYGTGPSQNPSQDPNNVFCRQIVRDTSGFASGGGRLSQPRGYTSLLNTNIGFIRTSGVDFNATYNRDVSDLGISLPGRISAAFNATYVSKHDQQLDLTQPLQHCAGAVGVICGEPIPKWRVNTHLTWAPTEALSLTARVRYISSVVRDVDKFSGTVADPVAHEMGAQTYFDLSGEWTVRPNLVVRAGALNIFDKQPPLLPNTVNVATDNGLSNTWLGTYDLGRQLFFGITAKY